MGIDDGVVVPTLRVESAEVDFTGGNHDVLAFAFHLVASHVQEGWELVVLAELLKLGKSIGHQGRVNDADICRGFGI